MPSVKQNTRKNRRSLLLLSPRKFRSRGAAVLPADKSAAFPASDTILSPPARYPRYSGTRGSTQGEKKLKSPCTKTAAADIPVSTVNPIPSISCFLLFFPSGRPQNTYLGKISVRLPAGIFYSITFSDRANCNIVTLIPADASHTDIRLLYL